MDRCSCRTKEAIEPLSDPLVTIIKAGIGGGGAKFSSPKSRLQPPKPFCRKTAWVLLSEHQKESSCVLSTVKGKVKPGTAAQFVTDEFSERIHAMLQHQFCSERSFDVSIHSEIWMHALKSEASAENKS